MAQSEKEMPEEIIREVLADRRYNFSYGSPGVRIGQAQAALDELLEEFQGVLDDLNVARAEIYNLSTTDYALKLHIAKQALRKVETLETGFSRAAREALEAIG